jgi:hypothetical protein
MALGPYNHPGLISEAALDNLLAQYNMLMQTPFGLSVTDSINSALFGGPEKAPVGPSRIPYQSDSSSGGNVSLDAGTHVFLEYGNTGASTIDFSTNGAPALIVIGASNSMNFTDLGSTGDAGDTIIGSDATNQVIAVTQGANLVIAGTGKDVIRAGSTTASNDSLYAGGQTTIYAGTAGEVHMRGGFYPTSTDSLVGGTGTDYMKVKYGDNFMVAGSGNDTITSLDRGNNGTGGDNISLLAGGNALVNIGTVSAVGTATDTVTFGGDKGDDTINALGSVHIDIASTEQLDNIGVVDGVTTLTFDDGQHLVYSGGSVTLTFEH